MDARQPSPLIDSAVEREIQNVLGVEPSPVFLARLRTTIADDPLPIARSYGFVRLADLAAVVALIVGLAFWYQYDRSVPASSTHLRERTPAAIVRIPHPEIVFSNAGARALQTPTAKRHNSRVAPPQVLISADNIKAFQQLVTGARESRFQLSFEDNTQFEQSGDVTELIVQPLAIVPLEWPTTDGVPQ